MTIFLGQTLTIFWGVSIIVVKWSYSYLSLYIGKLNDFVTLYIIYLEFNYDLRSLIMNGYSLKKKKICMYEFPFVEIKYHVFETCCLCPVKV